MTRHPAARNTDLADQLHSAALHLLRSLRKVDSASGITAPRLSVLSVVVFAGPRTLGELAQAEQVRPPTMTRLVAALEKEGLVRREVDKDDRRITRIHATSKGKKVMMEGRERRVSNLAARLAKLSATERRELQHAAKVMNYVARGALTDAPDETDSPDRSLKD
jgi:DNA-binding MarR family transcriptional regulator